MSSSSDLINQLEKDHREIEAIVLNIEKAIQSKAVSQIQEQLRLLRATIVAHKAHENWKLYTFLQRASRNDPEMVTSMNNARKGADQFVEHVEAFFNQYLNQDLSPETLTTFATELKMIKEGIAKRFHIEEKILFPIYKKL